MGRAYTHEEIQRIIRMRMASIHPQEIADIVNRSKITIDRLLSEQKKLHNFTYPFLQRSDTKWTRDKIEEMSKEACKNYKHAASIYMVSTPRIAYLMAKRAYSLR